MLKKLSLAALVAMGGMSVASATPLTEAIKNVDLNGMLRIRFYNTKQEDQNNVTAWRTNGIFIFKVPVAENINFVFRNSTQTYLKNTESNDGRIANTLGTVDSTMANNLLFMNYHQDGLNVIAGKIPVATPITSVNPATPTHGAGAIATYNVGGGFTLAAAFVTAMKNAAADNYGYIGQAINNDTYVLAGIYGSDAVKAQLWYYHVTNLLKYDAIASADLDLFKLANIQNDFDLQFHVDYATSKYDDNFQKNANSKNFFNVNVKGTVAGAALRVGYAKSSDDAGTIDLSYDSPLAASQAAVATYKDIANERDASMFYADASYNVTPAVKLSVAYANINVSDDAAKRSATLDSDLSDYTLKADYAYNKKLSFQARYDVADFDKKGSDNDELRLQALYKF